MFHSNRMKSAKKKKKRERDKRELNQNKPTCQHTYKMCSLSKGQSHNEG